MDPRTSLRGGVDLPESNIVIAILISDERFLALAIG